MSALFPRSWRLVAGGVDVSDMDLEFSVERKSFRAPGTATIKVHNLKPDTRAAIERGGVTTLRAGYAEQPTVIFTGDVRRVWTERDKATYTTTIEARDGGGRYFLARSSRSYRPGTPIATVVRDIVADMGVGEGNVLLQPLTLGNGATTFPDGWAHHGPAREALDAILRGCDLRWSIQGGAIQVVRRGRGLPDPVVLLSSATGLIESPTRGSGSNRNIVTVRALIQPGLEPGRTVRIESATVRGDHVIRKATYVGQTRGPDWTATLECRAPVVD